MIMMFIKPSNLFVKSMTPGTGVRAIGGQYNHVVKMFEILESSFLLPYTSEKN